MFRGQIRPAILRYQGMDIFCPTQPVCPWKDTLILLWPSNLAKMSFFGKISLQFQGFQLSPNLRHSCMLTKAWFVLLRNWYVLLESFVLPSFLREKKNNGTPKWVLFFSQICPTLRLNTPTFTGFIRLWAQFVLPSFGYLSYPTRVKRQSEPWPCCMIIVR